MKVVFWYIDKDNDGFLILKEFKIILFYNNLGIFDLEIEQFFKEIDMDGDGKIDLKVGFIFKYVIRGLLV